MRHVILTCKNHLNLRWVCEEASFTDKNGYDGLRSIFFMGEPTGKGMYADGSGLDCSTYYPDREPGQRVVEECYCSFSLLIRAPEDSLVKPY